MSRSTHKGCESSAPTSNFPRGFFSFCLVSSIPIPLFLCTTDAPFSATASISWSQAHTPFLSTLLRRCCHSFLSQVARIICLRETRSKRLPVAAKMHAPSLFVLAASALSAVAQTTTSTLYMTATVTITQCAPTNTDCPLYTPPPSTSSTSSIASYPVVSSSSSSSSAVPSSSSSSSSYSSFSTYSYPLKTTTPVHYSANSTTAYGGSTGYPTGSIPVSYPTFGTTSAAPTSSSPASTSSPATAGATSLAARSGLVLAAMGIGAFFLA